MRREQVFFQRSFLLFYFGNGFARRLLTATVDKIVAGYFGFFTGHFVRPSLLRRVRSWLLLRALSSSNLTEALTRRG